MTSANLSAAIAEIDALRRVSASAVAESLAITRESVAMRRTAAPESVNAIVATITARLAYLRRKAVRARNRCATISSQWGLS